MKKFVKRALSLLLVLTLLLGSVVVGFAEGIEGDDGVIGVYKIGIFNGSELVTDKIMLTEGESIQLNYQLIDESTMPDNSYVKWWSSTPTLASVTKDGLVRGHDSSKGAVCRLWLDNEVRTIPIVGKILAWPIEQIFNKIEVDQMDTDTIVAAIRELFSTDGVLGKYGSVYADQLCESLEHYLNDINSNIHVTIYSNDDEVIADAFVEVVVSRSYEPWADFIPNGTHITNKENLPSTVAKGSTVQLSACTTPTRLRMGVVYTVKNSSIISNGKAIATVDGSGLVTFKDTGTVTIMVSPDSKGFIDNLLKYINFIYGKVDGGAIAGVVDNGQIADILIKVLGLDINRTVLVGILDVISFVTGDATNPVAWASTAVKIIANFILQFTTNDTITFKVIEKIPVKSFEIDGNTTVIEGTETHLGVVNVKPEGANIDSIKWEVEDSTIASISQDGTVRGRDAGDDIILPKKEVKITATVNGDVQRSVTVTVRGKIGALVSDVEVIGRQFNAIGVPQQYEKVIYPARAAEKANFKWGIVSTNEKGEETIIYATEEQPATNQFGQIDINGLYTPLEGGETYIVAKAYTGTLFETSNAISKFKVSNGVPATGISIDQGEFVGKHVIGAFNGAEVTLSATVQPSNASNKKVIWSSSNKDITVDQNGKVTMKAAVEHGDYSIITATTEDGGFTASAYVSFVRNNVKSISLNQSNLVATVGKTSKLNASVKLNSGADPVGALEDIIWKSSDESIATVDQNGNVTGVETGTCEITATAIDSGLSISCQTTVKPDKAYLDEVVNIVEHTVIDYTAENKKLYLAFAKALDRCYYLQDEEMPLQFSCDQYANELLMAFYRLDSYVQLAGVKITMNGEKAPLFISKHCSTSTSYKNNKIELRYEFAPVNAMYKSIKWTSSDSKVSVNNGTCQPTENKACWSLITVTAEDYVGNVYTDAVIVSFVNYQVNGVKLDKQSIHGAVVGNTQQLKATVSSSSVIAPSIDTILWTSSNEKVATVDQDGKITFNYGGNAVITATTIDGGYAATCQVNVVTNFVELEKTIKTMDNLGLQEIDFVPDSWETFWATVNEGRAMLSAGTAEQGEVDDMIARINTARSEMVKYNHIQKIKIYLGDEEAPEHLTYDCSIFGEGFDYKNAKVDLGVRLYPTNGDYESVEWFSDNGMLKVTEDGIVSPTVNKPCYANISVVVRDDFGNEFTDSIYVVYAFTPATGVTLDNNEYIGEVNETFKLTPTVAPKGILGIGAASINEVLWYSENESVAEVSVTGTVTLKSAGAAKVICTTVDGGFTAECMVIVNGDKTALTAAIQKYKDTDLLNYEYDSGQNFAVALAEAQKVNESIYSSQAQIDAACEKLIHTYNSLIDYVFLESMNIRYNGNVVGEYLPIKVTTTYYHNTSVELTYDYAPIDAMVKSISWSTANNNHSNQVEINGNKIKITPKYDLNIAFLKGGYIDVILTATDYYGRTVSKTVTVSFAKEQATGISIDKTNITTTVFDEPIKLNATVSPVKAELKDVRFVSSNPNVAVVDGSGVITAVNTGSCTVTAYTMDGGHSASCQVSVVTDRRALLAEIEKADSENLQRTDFTPASFAAYEYILGNARQAVNDLSLEQSVIDQITYDLRTARNALVDYIGVKEMHMTYDGKRAPETITSVALLGSWATNNIQLGVVINPENAMYVSGEWSSSDAKVKVDQNGKCVVDTLYWSIGEYHHSVITYTVTDDHGRKFSTSTNVLFVKTAATGVTLDKTELNLNISDTYKLNVTVAPVKSGILKPGASCQTVSWSTSNSAVVQIIDGTIVAMGKGTATVTVKTLDGSFTADCTVRVS